MTDPRLPSEAQNSSAGSEQSIADEIEFQIGRLSRVLSLRDVVPAMAFGPQLEASFVADTSPARSRELRLTMGVALVCYCLASMLDGILVPDLMLRGVMLRLLVLPVLIWLIVSVPGMRGSAREFWVTATAMLGIGSLAIIAAASTSPRAPYALDTVTLGAICANTGLPLRFRHACLSTAAALFGIFLTAHSYEGIADGLPFALDLQALIGALFSLITTFRLERSARLTYLLHLKEQRRLDAVAAEREAFSALSQTDGLTGLGNRVKLERWSEAMIADRSNEGVPVGVLMIDIDDFKGYNDFYGHSAGDRCLRAIAETIGAVPRSEKDLAIRYGGEEFSVILAEVTVTEAVFTARRLLAAVADLRLEHAARKDGTAIVTISIGVSHVALRPGSDLNAAIDAADDALYAAKRNGRNRVEVACEPALLAAS